MAALDQRAPAAQRCGVTERTAGPEALPPGLAEHLEAFIAHLRSVRGLSPHTVRAYRGDVTALLGHLAAAGGVGLAGGMLGGGGGGGTGRSDRSA